MRKFAIMTLLWQQLIGGVILFSAVSSQDQSVAQGAQNSSPDKLSVQVFLTASDKKGSPATPVQSELSVSVDKQPSQINALRPAKNDPLLFALVVDTSRSDIGSADSIKKAALQLFQNLSTDGNRGYLVLFSGTVTISKQPLQVSQAQGALDAARFGGGTAVYDAIQQTCIQTLSRSKNPATPRRAILLISDGEGNLSHITHIKAEEAVEKDGVAVFSLVTRSSLAGPQGEHFLKEISQGTGGQAISVKNVTDGVVPLLAAIENQWALSFVPAQSLDQRFHSLDIKALKKGVHVFAPAHIFAP